MRTVRRHRVSHACNHEPNIEASRIRDASDWRLAILLGLDRAGHLDSENFGIQILSSSATG